MLLTKSVIRGENRDNQKKRSSRNNQIKRQKSVRLCVCVFADKSRPKRQFSYREEGGGVVLPFCRLIAQVLPKEKNDDR